MKYGFAGSLAAACIAFCLFFCPQLEARKPNVIFIMVDDLGWMDLAVQGNKVVDTPNIDRFAAEGMRFTSAYAAAPVIFAVHHARHSMNLATTTNAAVHQLGDLGSFHPDERVDFGRLQSQALAITITITITTSSRRRRGRWG